jgi:Cu2+-exporting ATPase
MAAPHAAHDKHAGHDPETFRRRFWLSLLLTIPVFLFSEMVQDWFGYSLDGVPGEEFVAAVLGSVVFLYGGHVFLIGGWREIRDRQPGMMLLISLAITVAFVSGVASSVGLIDLDFWWELSALVTVMLLGHWQEMAAIGRTRGALAALAELLPDEAERLSPAGGSEVVPVASLAVGDLVLVRPGGRVPADGTVVEGEAEFDESMISGESRPVPRRPGERVAAGTTALGASARVRVEAIGDATALAGIQRMVAAAQASSSRAQALADRAAAVLFYVAVAAGALTFAAWTIAGDLDAAITRTVTVLVIACPHALGLAVPLVIAISTEVSARHGILVKDRIALERMRNVDVVLFDKTGTLTEGRHVVTGAWAAAGDPAPMLRLAAAAEADSEHPLAQAIVSARPPGGAQASVSEFRAAAGIGVSARVDGKLVEVGGPRLLTRLAQPDGVAQSPLEEWQARGASILFVAVDGEVAGAISLEDRVRDSSRETVDRLHERGVRVAMITGDARNVADAVAGQLGIDEVFAEVLPANKAEAVADLQRRGEQVAMVGDGVNDAPALAQADVGIAIGAGTDVAIESAGVVLVSDDPRGVLSIRDLSRASFRKMVENLAWATGYNLAAIPLAAGVLSFAGITLTPAAGAVLMSLSTIIVAANAQLLRRVRLGGAGAADNRDRPAATPSIGRRAASSRR